MRQQMRSTRTFLIALIAAACLATPAAALAEEIPTPTISVKAAVVPIPGFPGTGNFYGKGASVEGTIEIQGSGYGATSQNPKGSPPPISGVNVYLPKGVKLHPAGFPTCSEAVLKNAGPHGCPS